MRGLMMSTLLTTAAATTAHAETAAWPRPVPCRIQDGGNAELMVATLGAVETPLAQGVFDPETDTVTLAAGQVIEHYYRDTLGIQQYAPLDKTVFPLPPSGWCTWYYYYNRITEDEVTRNAEWIAENLKDFGARYVQIDDGWQGDGDPQTGKRDWSVTHPGNFPSGMPALAARIKALGLTPGIWIAPHGQSHPEFVARHKDAFLFKPDGASASVTWEGDYLLDPSSPAAEAYLRDLFQTLCDWGYEYFKIDGQPIVVEEYALKKEFMRVPAGDPVERYRDTLRTIRDTIGKDRYLLGCWGMPVEGLGLLDGSRTKYDIVLGWEGGFMLALRAVQEDYYLHNIAWYSDPDVFILRSPLPYKQAQAWATIQGLSGLALMGTDRLEDLSEPRVELMRRIYPAVDIRPLDLFKVTRDKTIFDLKVAHLDGARNYDVVGLFNYDQDTLSPMLLQWDELGIETAGAVHAFDFWNQEYLGAWEAGLLVEVDPTSCRVLALMPDHGQIQLISTSRHITQGWIDLKEGRVRRRSTRVPRRQHPRAERSLRIALRLSEGREFHDHRRGGPHRRNRAARENHQPPRLGHGPLHREPQRRRALEGPIRARRILPLSPASPEEPAFERTGPDSGKLIWKEMYWLNQGYQVHLDGELLGYTPRAFFPLAHLDPAKKHVVEIGCVWEDGTASKPRARLEIPRTANPEPE